MLAGLKNFGRAIIPKAVFRGLQPYYHGSLALLASYYYGQPSRHLTVIGVTGTAGKSTVVNMLAAILNNSGHKTGFITTANYFDGSVERVNQHGLSMPGGPMLQQQLRAMVRNHCDYAIVETTSEGLAQNRHLGIKFTGALLTTLAPAHIEAHRDFAHYRAAKGRLFAALEPGPASFIGVNLDTLDADYFLQFPATKKFGITLKHRSAEKAFTYQVTNIVTEPRLKFTLNDASFELELFGEFNVYNAALAAACAHTLGIDLKHCADALHTFGGVHGRMQSISNDHHLKIFVDYAPEPLDMENALQAVNRLPHRNIIHVFGATGGHRDVRKRFEFGQISADLADTIIITNDDVYDSDPEQIAHNIHEGIERASSKKATEVVTLLDRRQAIRRALQMAQPDDVILITGKGSEQFLVLPQNQRIAWDEPTVVREELARL